MSKYDCIKCKMKIENIAYIYNNGIISGFQCEKCCVCEQCGKHTTNRAYPTKLEIVYFLCFEHHCHHPKYLLDIVRECHDLRISLDNGRCRRRHTQHSPEARRRRCRRRHIQQSEKQEVLTSPDSEVRRRRRHIQPSEKQEVLTSPDSEALRSSQSVRRKSRMKMLRIKEKLIQRYLKILYE